MIFIDYPVTILEKSCDYNDTSGLRATYHFSWYIKGSVVGKNFQDIVGLWVLDGECHYPNGTKVVKL